MTESLRLQLFGQPQITLNGKVPLETLSAKALALLFYLAVNKRPFARATLSNLLWGELSDTSAKTNLRKILSQLHHCVGTALDSSHHTVEIKVDNNCWVDVVEFEAKVADFTFHHDSVNASVERLMQAVELYQGDFLEGFQVRESPDFEQWMLSERLRYRELVLQALDRLVLDLVSLGNLPAAIYHLRRLLALDPWREDAHRRLMLLLLKCDQRSAALMQYQICCELLSKDLNIAPEAETTQLYEQIRNGAFSDKATQWPGSTHPEHSRNKMTEPFVATPPVSPSHNLPVQLTPFIGRTKEISEVLSRLGDATCHLLTLTGPGGIGKSRLAIQVAQASLENGQAALIFQDGVWFVQLDTVDSVDDIIATIAQAAGFDFCPDCPPRQQLLDKLRAKSMLFVLDNFAHLHEGIRLIDDILTGAPHVKILVTARTVLNLQEEWLHYVTGMSYVETNLTQATETEQTETEQADAIQLFMQCARRAQAEFVWTTEQKHVLRICQWVEGMPLAIELAASWLSVMPCAQIAEAITQNLDLLSARWHNLPERHRSIRTVFQHSLGLLSESERAVLLRLAVFSGDFQLEAAEQVVGASLETVVKLVENSLLQTTWGPAERGHYRMHGLLRQFAQELLQTEQTQNSF